MDFQGIRKRANTEILIKPMTASNANAAPNPPATIPTDNDDIAIAKIASLEMITMSTAEA